MALPLTPITNLNGSAIGAINNNSEKIADEFEKTFYKDGSVNMDGPLDMDSNRIINLPRATTPSSPVTLEQFLAEKKGDQGMPGLPGVGGNTFQTLASLKLLNPATYASAILADGTRAPISYAYVLGNFTGLADDVNVVELSSVPLSTGALVKQNGTSINFDGKSVSDKLLETVSATDGRFGAKGDNVTDDKAAIMAAIANSSNTVNIPAGSFATSASIDVFRAAHIKGAGASFTSINPKNASAGDNTLTLVGTSSNELTTVEDLFLGDPSNGIRTGLDGLLFLTSATGQYFAKPAVRNISVGFGTGWAIHHYHSSPEAQGGFYCGTIENNLLRGGIYLEQSGDSNNILNNIISGSRIGVRATLIQGASLLAIVGNNITASGGAIRIEGGSRFRIVGNNTENYVAGAGTQNNSSVFYLNGVSETLVGGVIEENLISAFGATTATKLLYLQNCRGTLIQNNVFLTGAAGVVTDIEIGNTCRNIRIGANTFNRANGDVPAPAIIDNGVGTMGLVKTVALANSWVENAVGQGLRFIKTFDGLVHLRGSIKNGTAMDGTVVGTLPVGFRPSSAEWAPAVYIKNDGTYKSGQAVVNTEGGIEVYGVSLLGSADATRIIIDMTFPADGLANAFSPE